MHRLSKLFSKDRAEQGAKKEVQENVIQKVWKAFKSLAPVFLLYFDIFKDILLLYTLIIVQGGLGNVCQFYSNFASVVRNMKKMNEESLKKHFSGHFHVCNLNLCSNGPKWPKTGPVIAWTCIWLG